MFFVVPTVQFVVSVSVDVIHDQQCPGDGLCPKLLQKTTELLHLVVCRGIFDDRLALDTGGSEEGVTSLSAAVLDASGTPVAALGIAAPSERFQRDGLIRQATPLRDAASDLGRILHGSSSQTPMTGARSAEDSSPR
jgi:hypothetical protein